MESMIIRRGQLKQMVGISPSTVDRLEASGNFPQRRRWSIGVVGWLRSDVENWVIKKSEPIKKGRRSDGY
jgi:predicted DNA-binding transcriptional regulator AlpA